MTATLAAPRRPRRLVMAGNLLAGGLLAGSWLAAARATTLEGQVPALDVAATAVVVQGVTNCWWLLLVRRSFRSRRPEQRAAVGSQHQRLDA